MPQDPIVEEVRRIRDQYAKRFKYDLHDICNDLRCKQKRERGDIVSFPSKKPIFMPVKDQ